MDVFCSTILCCLSELYVWWVSIAGAESKSGLPTPRKTAPHLKHFFCVGVGVGVGFGVWAAAAWAGFTAHYTPCNTTINTTTLHTIRLAPHATCTNDNKQNKVEYEQTEQDTNRRDQNMLQNMISPRRPLLTPKPLKR